MDKGTAKAFRRETTRPRVVSRKAQALALRRAGSAMIDKANSRGNGLSPEESVALERAGYDARREADRLEIQAAIFGDRMTVVR